MVVGKEIVMLYLFVKSLLALQSATVEVYEL